MTTLGTTKERVFRIIQSHIERVGNALTQVTRESHLVNDLGFDSLDHVEITMDVEEEFSLIIPDGVAERIATVGQLVDYLETILTQ